MKIIERLVNKLLTLNMQIRLVVGFLIAACLTGLVATLIGIWTINRSTLDEVQNRVSQDINTAKLIYNYTLERIVSLVQFHAEGSDLYKEVAGGKLQRVESLKALILNVPVTGIRISTWYPSWICGVRFCTGPPIPKSKGTACSGIPW
jgi:hypothetical protein